MGVGAISWLSAFFDFGSVPDFAAGTEFWAAVTGYSVSSRRGVHDEFATLVPRVGDDYLRVQRLSSGPGRVHLDVHVADPYAAAARSGAEVVFESPDGYVVLRSPGGFAFCLVGHERAVPPVPVQWADGSRSRVDQICLDIPSSVWPDEVAFWAEATGWEVRPATARPEFARLGVPAELPLRWLLQRLETESGPVRAHVDVAASDRDAEVARHVALGASATAVHALWTTLTDPTGARYCITDRNPDTGNLLPSGRDRSLITTQGRTRSAR